MHGHKLTTSLLSQNTNTAGSCTSNFIFKQGETLYIGQAAHCASTGSSTDTE